ncbi:ATP-binding protein [Schwartzia sp. (in: firmicutes)]
MANENGIGRWRKYNAEMEIYEQLRDDVMDDARSLGMSEKKLNTLELGVEEIAVNIISYAYEKAGPLWVRTSTEDGLFRLEFADHGRYFDPLAEDMRHTDGVPTEEQAEGGYGIFLVKQFFSSVTYRYEEMFGEMANHLTMELLL